MNTNILTLIGNTPLVEIRRLNPNPMVRILAKIESVNPGGSIKDRVAAAMIRAAEESGELTPGKTIIEATSGNTGIGLAMVAAIKGYKIKLLMPDTASEERKTIMRSYGAEIQLTPGRLSTDGAIEQAYRMAREEPHKYVLMDQFNNPASIDAHYNGTALEIWKQTRGKVTHVVAALGTSGTAMGLAKRLHEMNRDITVAAVEPYVGHKIQGLKNMHESYPPSIYRKESLDAIIHVEDQVAFDLCRKLAGEEGLFVGMSSGAALGGALKLAESLDSGLIVVIFPDGGERYLSTQLFVPRTRQGSSLCNIATGSKVTLDTGSGLGLYTMGPSIDNTDGLNSWRRLVLLDVLLRYLKSVGISVHAAAGLSDLDDRTLNAARLSHTDRGKFVTQKREYILELARQMDICETITFPLASDSKPVALELCRKLMAKGLAYEKLRSVYFDVFRDERYGGIGVMNMDKLSTGKTVNLDAYIKDNPLDFTLLKRVTLLDLKEGNYVETEWGNVRPSWFLQHAAAAFDTLPGIDVFLGSESHQFPHLENLRAIWTMAGKELQAWMVSKLVYPGNIKNLGQLIEQSGNARVARLWLLSGSYRKPLTAGQDSIAMWTRNWNKVREGAINLAFSREFPGQDVPEDVEQAVFDLKSGFKAAVEDDLELYRFWPVLFRFIRQVNSWISRKRISGEAAKLCYKHLMNVDNILRILDRSQIPLSASELPEKVRDLLIKREKARSTGDYKKSDQIRDEIAQAGFGVEDTAAGSRVLRR